MKIMGISGIYLDPKEQIMMIYKGYKFTRPDQSNMFRTISRSYTADMIKNAGNIDLQMEDIKTSLNTILQRYYYTNINVYIKFNELENEFLIDIEARNKDGIDIKLSDSLILEKK